MFKKLNKLKKAEKFIYSLIIAVAIVGIWRGVWMLLDLYLLPKNNAISAVVSLVIGVLVLAVTHHKLS